MCSNTSRKEPKPAKTPDTENRVVIGPAQLFDLMISHKKEQKEFFCAPLWILPLISTLQLGGETLRRPSNRQFVPQIGHWFCPMVNS